MFSDISSCFTTENGLRNILRIFMQSRVYESGRLPARALRTLTPAAERYFAFFRQTQFALRIRCTSKGKIPLKKVSVNSFLDGKASKFHTSR